MATIMLIVERADGSYVEWCGAGIRDRLATRLRAAKLDRELAAGSSPDASVRLSLRARVLGRTATRLALARRLRAVIAEAEHGPALATARMPVCRHKVLIARSELEELAIRLTAPGVLGAEGIALTRRLLMDGSGPIYARPRADDLVIAALGARRALDP
jgi:hypothetical protein